MLEDFQKSDSRPINDRTHSTSARTDPSRQQPANLLPRELDSDALVLRINAINADENEPYKLERIGELMFKHPFGGDPQLVKSAGRKYPPYRCIAEHPGLELSPTILWQTTKVCALWDSELPREAEILSIPTLFDLLAIQDPDVRSLLTIGAAREGWSRDRFKQEQRKLQRSGRGRRGVAPEPKLARVTREAESWARSLAEFRASHGSPFVEVGLHQLDRLSAVLQKITTWHSEAQRYYAHLVNRRAMSSGEESGTEVGAPSAD